MRAYSWSLSMQPGFDPGIFITLSVLFFLFFCVFFIGFVVILVVVLLPGGLLFWIFVPNSRFMCMMSDNASR